MTIMLASKPLNFEDDVDQGGRQASPRAGDEAHQNGEFGAVSIDDEDGAGGPAHRESAIDGEIDEAQNAKGDEDSDAGQGVAEPLPNRADIDVAERHE